MTFTCFDLSIPAVARDLGVHATMIGKWQRDLQSEGKKAFPGHGKPRDEERTPPLGLWVVKFQESSCYY